MKRRGPKLFTPAKADQKPWRDRLDIVDLCDDGRGLARRSGKAVFVRGGLPGEEVDARSERIGGRFDEAIVSGVLKASLHRIEPGCRHYEQCGGCQLQHLGADAQQAHKSRRFSALIERLGVGADAILPPLIAQPWHYRHRLRLHFAKSKGQFALGFRVAKSHRITEVPDCQVLRPALQASLAQLYCDTSALERMHSGMLMLAEAASGSVSAHLVLDRRPSQTAMSDFLANFPLAVSGISVAGQSLWQPEDQPDALYPGQNWRFRPDDFTQVNPDINSAIVEQVCRWLDAKAGDQVMDAFSGLGNFSLALAASGASITGIEQDAQMVARASANAQAWPLVRCVQGDLFSDAFRLPQGISSAVLDPPRAGAAALCRQLAISTVQRIVYVSCDPATLERDAAILLAGGYTLRQARWAEMFPQSYHMESLCLFERRRV